MFTPVQRFFFQCRLLSVCSQHSDPQGKCDCNSVQDIGRTGIGAEHRAGIFDWIVLYDCSSDHYLGIWNVSLAQTPQCLNDLSGERKFVHEETNDALLISLAVVVLLAGLLIFLMVRFQSEGDKLDRTVRNLLRMKQFICFLCHRKTLIPLR